LIKKIAYSPFASKCDANGPNDVVSLPIAQVLNQIRGRDIDNALCINLINCLPRRLRLVREANGGQTKY
jgi:hypothetical protein